MFLHQPLALAAFRQLTLPVKSEQEFQGQLNDARRQRGLNLVERRRTDVAVGQAEVGMIENVEEFDAELEVFDFGDPEFLIIEKSQLV